MFIRKSSLVAAAVASLLPFASQGSSHREAPNIAGKPTVDSTDFYLFNSYEAGRDDYVTILANYIPLQQPYGGPNYFAMDPAALYEIHIDNDGDAKENLTFQFRFTNRLANDNRGIKRSTASRDSVGGGTEIPIAVEHKEHGIAFTGFGSWCGNHQAIGPPIDRRGKFELALA